MTVVAASLAQWLKSVSLTATAEDAAVIATWGNIAATSEIVSPIALLGDAEAEAARQLTFLSSGLVVERLQVSGLRHDLIGEVVELRADRGGYSGGHRVFVIGVEELQEVQATNITVLRRLT